MRINSKFSVFLVVGLTAIILTSAIFYNLPSSSVTPELKGNLPVLPLAASKDQGSKSILSSSFSINSNELISNSLAQAEETLVGSDHISNIGMSDNKLFTLDSYGPVTYQRFEMIVDDSAINEEKINILWEGRSNRVVNLYAWDFSSEQWIKLQTAMTRNKDNLVVEAALNKDIMIKEKSAHIMVGTANNSVLPGRIPSQDEYDFTLAWITDTQYYAASYPNIFEKITRYIVNQRREKNIIYAIHTGDLVDNTEDLKQWAVADQSMSILDKANLPYGVAAGNHDVWASIVDYTNYLKYFGENRFSEKSYYGGTPNNNRDHYDLISSNGMDFIIIYLGWSIEKNTLDWANQILKQYPNRKAIIALHSYISPRNTYNDQSREVIKNLVEPNHNVFMVLCGHYHGTTSVIKRVEGRVVYELLSDYQYGPEGGSGYIRFLQFDVRNNLVYVNTYSPHTNDYNFFETEKDQFILPLHSENGNVILATDFIGFNTKSFITN